MTSELGSTLIRIEGVGGCALALGAPEILTLSVFEVIPHTSGITRPLQRLQDGRLAHASRTIKKRAGSDYLFQRRVTGERRLVGWHWRDGWIFCGCYFLKNDGKVAADKMLRPQVAEEIA